MGDYKQFMKSLPRKYAIYVLTGFVDGIIRANLDRKRKVIQKVTTKQFQILQYMAKYAKIK